MFSFIEKVKAVNGSNRCNGKVQLYHNGRWNRVCNIEWSKAKAGILCQEMNCGTPIEQTEVPNFGEANVQGGIKTVCSGNETSIGQCTVEEVRESCVDATVSCTRKLPVF